MSVPRETFLTNAIVLVVLLALTGLTVAAAYAPLGVLHLPAALFLAGVKTIVVVVFYMHMRHAESGDWIAIGTGLLLLGVLIGMMLSDYITRGWGT